MADIKLIEKQRHEYVIGVDTCNGTAAFTVMRNDGELMEYGNGKDDDVFKSEVERVMKYYNIPESKMFKETR